MYVESRLLMTNSHDHGYEIPSLYISIIIRSNMYTILNHHENNT